jgi:hypothetical protein
MKTLSSKILEKFEEYPLSLAAYVLSLIPWVLVYVGQLRINFNPVPAGVNDYRGEGLAYAALLALLLASILLTVTVINLIFQKVKRFYLELIALIIVGNLVLYGIGII